MTENEKQELVEAVVGQLKSSGTDMSTVSIIEDVGEMSTLVGYDKNGKISRLKTEGIGSGINDEELTDIKSKAISKIQFVNYNEPFSGNVNLALAYDTIEGGASPIIQIPTATKDVSGVMSAEDKRKLDSLSQGGDVTTEQLNEVRQELTDTKGELIVEANRAKEAERANSEAIYNEAERAKKAEELLEVQIADEALRATRAEKANADAIVAEKARAEQALADEIDKIKDGGTIVGQAREIHSEDGRSLVDETRNFLDKMYANTGKESANEVADYITDNIADNKAKAEEAPNLALRALFVAAGAEYNDTDSVITKTAPWGESVQHLPKHYYLNGLGDITEEQMMEIYTYTFPLTNSADWNSALRRLKSDDNMVRTNLFRKDFYASGNIQSLMGAFMMSLIEVVCLSGKNDVNNQAAINLKKSNYLNAFSYCYNLKHIIARLDLSQQGNDTPYIGYNNPKLITCYLSNLCGNLRIFDTSVNISKESILFCVRSAKTTSAITITLHPDAYARLADDAEIVAALEAQPLVSLVSA